MAVLPSLLNVFLIATSVTASAASATIAGIRSSFVTERNPRLFYVSTFTSTSMGTTLCFIPNAACPNFGNPCPTCSPTGRKRRRALPDDQPEENYVTEEEDGLHSMIEDMEEDPMKRKAKALLYWMTTTSTFTWYTSTSTIASIECTPNG